MPSPDAGTWHPKLTPYRLLVLFTTIGLGTAKAYATSRNISLVATTIEWITGVLIFSIIFVLDLYEPNPPRYLLHFFEFDLMVVVCKLISVTPQYRSDEMRTFDLRGPHPPITGYRLLTSMSVTLFGVTKAYLGYHSLTPGVNTVDWIYGVIIVSCLYVLGLYERNPLNVMPYLFSTDYSYPLYTISWLFVHLTGLSVCFLGLKLWFSFVPSQIEWPSLSKPSLQERLMNLVLFIMMFVLPVVLLTTLAGFLSGRILDFSQDSFLLRQTRKLFHGTLRRISSTFRSFYHYPGEPSRINTLSIFQFLRNRMATVLVYTPILVVIALYAILFLSIVLQAWSQNARVDFVASLLCLLVILVGFVFYLVKFAVRLFTYEQLHGGV